MPLSRSTEFDLAHTYGGIPFGQTLPIRSSILSYLTDHASKHGDDPFITAVSADGQVTTISYRELDVLSRRVASWLQRELHVRAGDVLALLPGNDVTSVVTIFGLLRAGCAVLFLNPADPVQRLQQQADALDAKAVFRVPAISVHVFPRATLMPDPLTLDEEHATGVETSIKPLNDALFFGTSGSTAASKLVAQSHYNAAVNAQALCRHHKLRRGDRLLGCLPIHHVNCLHFTIFATLAAGAHAILAHTFNPFGYPRLVERFRPRIASVVPSILEALLGTWRQPVSRSWFGYFVSAAAPLAARTARGVIEKLGVRVLQGYGLTETTNFSTTLPSDLQPDMYQRLMLDAEIPSIGTELYGNEVAVLTNDAERAAPGEIGEICMRGHNVMMRYAGNGAATAEAFRNGWFHSQDLGFEIVDGGSGRSFFVITGRSKNVAKVRGEAVSLEEMEHVLCALPQVSDAACVALPHRLFGEEIIAAVVFSPGAANVDLKSHLRTVFGPNALPSRIVKLDAVPRTATGKILRTQLAEQLAALGDDAVAH